ncbi:MAG TPA: hypothetical protein VIM56_03800 [Rhizomicrobium sp.]
MPEDNAPAIGQGNSRSVVTEILVLWLIGIPLVAWKAFAFMKLWNWFLCATIAVAPLSYGLAVGVVLLAGFIIPTSNNASADKDPFIERIKAVILNGLINPAIVLALGWIMHVAVAG